MFLKPLAPATPYVFGRVYGDKLNGAILGLPAGDPMVDDYMNAINAVPLRTPWATMRRRLWRDLEILAGYPMPPPAVQTNIGPRALTYFAKMHGILSHAVARDVFYPIGTNDPHMPVPPAQWKLASRLPEPLTGLLAFALSCLTRTDPVVSESTHSALAAIGSPTEHVGPD